MGFYKNKKVLIRLISSPSLNHPYPLGDIFLFFLFDYLSYMYEKFF